MKDINNAFNEEMMETLRTVGQTTNNLIDQQSTSVIFIMVFVRPRKIGPPNTNVQLKCAYGAWLLTKRTTDSNKVLVAGLKALIRKKNKHVFLVYIMKAVYEFNVI